MSYTARQQQGLKALGLVPWVLRNPGSSPRQPTQASDDTALGEVPMASARGDTGLPVAIQAPPMQDFSHRPATRPAHKDEEHAAQAETLTVEISRIPALLPTRRLLPLAARAGTVPSAGSEQATLLVVAECAPGQLPEQALAGEAGQLFDLMLQAIDLARRDVRLFAVLNMPHDSDSSAPTLSEVSSASARGVLLMVQDWGAAVDLQPISEHHCRLHSPALPLWRIPHPDVLLRQNQLKRQAWIALQSLQATIYPSLA